MIAQNILRNDITPLQPADKVLFAHELMDEFKVQHLPVVDEGVYLGLISEDDLLDTTDDSLSIKEGSSNIIRSFLQAEKHLFDAIALFGELNVSMLPVLDSNEKYLGYVYPKDIVVAMGGMLSSRIPGSILVLEVNQNDYQMSQIAQIIEGNDAKILASFITSSPDSTLLEITLRINRTDLTGIIQTFNRYDYAIAATFHESLHEADLQDRFDNFINYLNM